MPVPLNPFATDGRGREGQPGRSRRLVPPGDAKVQAYLDRLVTSGWRAIQELKRDRLIKAVGVGVDLPGDLPGFPERVDADVFLIAIPFVLGHPNVATVIPGAAGVERAPRLHGEALRVGCPVTWTMVRS